MPLQPTTHTCANSTRRFARSICLNLQRPGRSKRLAVHNPAILKGPGGAAVVTSVWYVRTGEAVARFVTAYPGGKA
jgi:hypothetical protein